MCGTVINMNETPSGEPPAQPQPLFGENSVHGDQEEFCQRIIDTINGALARESSGTPIIQEGTAAETLAKIPRMKLLEMMSSCGVSLDDAMPLELTSEQVSQWMPEVERRAAL